MLLGKIVLFLSSKVKYKPLGGGNEVRQFSRSTVLMFLQSYAFLLLIEIKDDQFVIVSL